MVAVVIRLWPVGLAELQILILAHFGTRHGVVTAFHLSRDSHHLGIESENGFCGPDRHVELHIGNAERDAPKTPGVRLVAAHAIAPGAGRLDIIVVLAEGEFGALELFGDRRQPGEQRPAARNDQPDMTAQHLRPAVRQVKLAPSGVDPHVGVGHHQIGIAGEPEARDVEQSGEALVRDLDVDVLEMDRVAEIFSGPIELLGHGCGSRVG